MKNTLFALLIAIAAGFGVFAFFPETTLAQTATCVQSREKECFPLPGGSALWTWTTYLKGACLNSSCSDIAQSDHLALDIAAVEGTPVFSPWDGVVEIAGEDDGCGRAVQILHPSVNRRTRMCHFQRASALPVHVGERVSAGDLVGYVYNSGRSHGNHLHIQVTNTVKGSVMREQEVVSLPAFRGINQGGIGGASTSPVFLTATAGTTPKASDIKLNLELDWPRLPGVNKTLNELVEGTSTIYLQNIVNFIFLLVLWVSAIIAFVSVIYAGFSYIISGANPTARSKSIQGIKNVVFGTAILLSSVVLLNFINPNLAILQIGISLPPEALHLLAPTAPTASGGLRQNTTDHKYYPIPFTDRTGAEDTFAAQVVMSSETANCFEEADTKEEEDTCTDKYEKEIANKFKAAGAIIVWDDDDSQPSCAAVCMQLANDSLNCRQFGSGQDNDSGGAKMIWDRIRNSDGSAKWVPSDDGFYHVGDSINDKWLRDDDSITGDEDLESRQCVAAYVVEAIDAPGDFGWDACFCNTSVTQ